MPRWPKVLRIPILDIDYEEVSNQSRGSGLAAGLNSSVLHLTKDCLHFHESSGSVATASREQVRKPLYSSSIGRWRHYERHLDELKRGLRR